MWFWVAEAAFDGQGVAAECTVSADCAGAGADAPQ